MFSRSHLADTLAKIGNVDAAREECRKTADLLQRSTGKNVNVSVERSLVIAWMGVGDAYSTLAANKSSASPKEDWRIARDSYQSGLDIFQELRRAGATDAEEIAEIDKLAAKVVECSSHVKNSTVSK
jgi:hypothetical protein